MAQERETLEVEAAHHEVFFGLRKQVDDFLGQVQELQKGLIDRPWTRGFAIVPHRHGVQLRAFGSLLARDALAKNLREPFLRHELDVEAGVLRIWAELPGAAPEDVSLDVGPDHLRVEARTDNGHYRAFLEPGMSLDPERVDASCQHGLLSLAIPLRATDAKRVRHIRLT